MAHHACDWNRRIWVLLLVSEFMSPAETVRALRLQLLERSLIQDYFLRSTALETIRPVWASFEPQVFEGQWSAALQVVIVMLVHYLRPAPCPKGAPTQGNCFAGPARQIECPGRIGLACRIRRNRGLSNGYRQSTDFGHYVKRD